MSLELCFVCLVVCLVPGNKVSLTRRIASAVPGGRRDNSCEGGGRCKTDNNYHLAIGALHVQLRLVCCVAVMAGARRCYASARACKPRGLVRLKGHARVAFFSSRSPLLLSPLHKRLVRRLLRSSTRHH